MKVSISYKAQEVFDKALSDPSIDPTRPITGKGYKVWVDEPTSTLCKVSTLSGTVMGFVSVGRNHPWLDREDCPLPGISSYGTISHPVECRGLWWFYFTLPGEGKGTVAKAMQKCRILAAQLEVEGTELAQQIAQLSQLKSEGSEDDGDDEVMHDAKVRDTLEQYMGKQEFYGSTGPQTTKGQEGVRGSRLGKAGKTQEVHDAKVRNTLKGWGNCTLTEFPVLGNNYKAEEFKRAFAPSSSSCAKTPDADKYYHAYEDLMECIRKEIAKYASDEELENIIKHMDTD